MKSLKLIGLHVLELIGMARLIRHGRKHTVTSADVSTAGVIGMSGSLSNVVIPLVPPPVPPSGSTNEPNGYKVVLYHEFPSKPVSTSGITGRFSTSLDTDPDCTIVTANGDTALRTRFPAGLAGGAPPCTMRAWDTGTTDGTRYRKLYIRMKVGIPTPDFENQSVACKLWYVGYGNELDSQDNDGFLVIHGSGTQEVRTDFQLGPYLSETLDRDGPSHYHAPNVDTRRLFTCGRPHIVEVRMDLGTPDNHDGVYEQWIDGIKTHNITDQKYLDSRQFTKLFHDWQWTPVWGGVGGTRTRTDNIDLYHVYISGSN
jgi:hypothetical protein